MRRVVITGLGAVTPLGDTAHSSWTNLLSGLTGIKEILSLPEWSHLHRHNNNLSVHLGAPVSSAAAPSTVSGSFKLPRNALFAEMAAAEALKDSKLPIEFYENVGVFFGCGLPALSEVYNHSQSISEGVRILTFHYSAASFILFRKRFHLTSSQLSSQIFPPVTFLVNFRYEGQSVLRL